MFVCMEEEERGVGRSGGSHVVRCLGLCVAQWERPWLWWPRQGCWPELEGLLWNRQQSEVEDGEDPTAPVKGINFLRMQSLLQVES